MITLLTIGLLIAILVWLLMAISTPPMRQSAKNAILIVAAIIVFLLLLAAVGVLHLGLLR